MRVKREFEPLSSVPLADSILVRSDGGYVLPAGDDLLDTVDAPSVDPSTDLGVDSGDSDVDSGEDSSDGLLSALSLPTLSLPTLSLPTLSLPNLSLPLPPPLLTSTTTVRGVATATTTVMVNKTTSPTSVTKSSQFPTVSQPAKANTPTALAASTAIAASTALAASPAQAIPSGPYKDSMDNDSNMGLSKTTEHLLIAAGSIAATLAVVFIVFVVYRIRRGHTLTNLFGSKEKRRNSSNANSPPRRGDSWNSFQFLSGDAKGTWDQPNSRADGASELPRIPRKALVRQGTGASNRPLVSDSKLPGRNPSPQRLNAALQVLPEEDINHAQSSHPSRQASRRQAPSIQPSSPILPIERSIHEFFEESDASHQSIPTYLREHGLYSSPPKASRFSWTNSNAPKTSNDSRYSIATSTSSVPRYRTVESWVGAQTGRIDPAKFQDHLRREYEASAREPVPEVPSLPKSPGRRSKLVKHRPHMSDASVFRVHPGTRIDIPRTSLIPSEILDARIQPHAL